jgi:RimJ/RimL family protein N-acetyltransferase
MNADRCDGVFSSIARTQAIRRVDGARSLQHGTRRVWVEERMTSLFIGFTGLAVATFAAPFTPATEIGWRLSRQAWGKGYASEAAAAVRDLAFEALGLAELVSFTSQQNHRSRRVMEKIGMTCDPADDFIHPGLPSGHELAPHVLYRILSGAVSN